MEKPQLTYFFYIVTIVGLVVSPFLLSVGMISLAVLSLIRFRVNRRTFWVDIDREAIGRMFQLLRYPSYAAVTLFFFVVLIGPLPEGDWGYWWGRLRIKLPFVGLPLVFLGHPPLSKRGLNGLLYFLTFFLLLTAIGVSTNYFLNAEEIDAMLKKGHPMPTPRNHIRYSLIVALSVLAGGYLYQQGFYLKYRWERWLTLASTLLLFAFMHLLSVRTGLVGLYFAIGILTLRYIVLSRRYLVGGLLLLLLAAAPVAAYYAVPSLKAKVDYMRWSYLKYQEGEGEVYADPGRIASLQIGWELFREHPIVGIGHGNLRAEVERRFDAYYPGHPKALLPHNQFLFVMAGSGLLGLLLFLIGFFYPLFYRRNYRHAVFLGFYSVAFLSFAIEHTIENSIGVGFYVFFLLLLLTHLNRRLPAE